MLSLGGVSALPLALCSRWTNSNQLERVRFSYWGQGDASRDRGLLQHFQIPTFPIFYFPFFFCLEFGTGAPPTKAARDRGESWRKSR